MKRTAASSTTYREPSNGGPEMKAIVELGVVPIGVGVSLSKYVAACETVLKEAGLEHHH